MKRPEKKSEDKILSDRDWEMNVSHNQGLDEYEEYHNWVLEPLKAISNKGLSRLNLETAIEESLNRSKEV